VAQQTEALKGRHTTEMDEQTVELVMVRYRTAMAKAAAWGAAPSAELPFPPETIKEAVVAWAEDLNRKGELDEEAVNVLALCYRSLARFLSGEEAEFAVPAFRKYRHLTAEQIKEDPAAPQDLPRLEGISEQMIADARKLEAEFLAFLRELNPKALAKAKQRRGRQVS
jgi:hypothetical protein